MEAWFSAESAPLFSFLSLFALLACLSEYAKQGRRRMGVMTVYWGVFGLGIAFLIGAGAALLLRQPSYVIFTLGLTGALMTATLGYSITELAREYRKAELRQIFAQDL